MASTTILTDARSRGTSDPSLDGLFIPQFRAHEPRIATERLLAAFTGLDAEARAHARRVQGYSVALGRRVGLGETDLDALADASLLHDIGKLSVPRHILNKPGPLTPEEFHQVKQHSAVGARIVARARLSATVVAIIRHHHENWDGTGYPDRMAERETPVGARVLMVVDCFDALTSDRPYRGRLSVDAAVQIIAGRRGTMYDPRVVDAFLRARPSELPTRTNQSRAS
jgi:putative nucleotidyltransferase with HDIG domain